MAFTYHNKGQTVSSTANPVTVSVTTNTYTNLAVLCIITEAGTRAGGAPTYFGNTMTQAGSTESSAEGSTELWYLLNDKITKSTGGTFSVPNSSSHTLTIVGSVYDSPNATKWAYFEVVDQTNNTTANPSVTVGTYTGPSVIVNTLFTGNDFAGFMSAGQTALYSGDTGNEGYGVQYFIDNIGTSKAMTWTVGADDWAMIGAAFTERDAPDITSHDTVAYANIASVDSVSRENIASIDTVATNNI